MPSNDNKVSPAAGVHSLDRFELSVPDLDEASRFFSAFGLTMRRSGNSLEARCPPSDHVWMVLREGERKHLDLVRFTAFPEALAPLADRLAAAGALDKSDGAHLTGRTPDGLALEVVAGAKSSPDVKASFVTAPPYSATQASAPTRLCAKVAPRRLSHVALFTPDVDRSIEFFSKVLGIRLSDRSQSDVAFMHGAFGSDHHMIALARSTGPGLHHSSWEVESTDEVGLGAKQMEAAGYRRGWGLGRHVLGSNYFHYVRDPWGSYAEYSAGMDYIAADREWVARDHPPEDSFYQWGPPPPEDFIENYELG